jgi:hypothetical protein
MEITTITVTRKRSKQPEQFGNASAEITVVANLEAGEDWQDKTRELLVNTRALVYENLNLKLPASVTNVTNVANVTETVETKVETTEKTTEVKKPRGRPRKNTSDIPGTVQSSDDDSSTDTVAKVEDSTEQMTQGDLKAYLTALVTGNKITMEDVRRIILETAGVVLSTQVADERVQDVHDAIEAFLAEKAAA